MTRKTDNTAGRQRCLIITRNLPPVLGGMERLNWHIADQLTRYADVLVVGPAGADVPQRASRTLVAMKPLGWFLPNACLRAMIHAVQWRPEVVLAGSGLTAPLAWLAARLSGARAAAYLHGLDVTVDSRVYRRVWLPVIRRMDCVIVNSSATRRLAVDAGVPDDRLNIVPPGVELPTDIPSRQAIDELRRHHDFGQRRLLLSVGRLTARKGMLEFVRDVLPQIIESQPDALLVMVGDTPDNALHAERQTAAEITAAAEKQDLGHNLCFVGAVTDWAKLGTLYSAADVHVFPVQHRPDDPEGFGMVAIEAAAFGLPTVAYATGGVVDAVADGQSGYLVSPGDDNAFAELTSQLLRQPLSTHVVRAHAAEFSWASIGSRLTAVLSNA